jgi:hypothetical protein
MRITSYISCAAVDRDGNARPAKRYVMCRRGNDLVRRYLWMAALSAISCNPAVRPLYARVVAKHPDKKAIAAGADLDGHRAKVGDEFRGRLEAVDIEDKGGEHRGGDGAIAGNRVEMVWFGQSVIGVGHGFFQAQLTCVGVAQLADLIAD